MRGFIIIIALIGLLVSTGRAGPILVGTWNVQNYLLQNRYLYDKYRFDYPKPESQKQGLRAAILEIRPDVLFLQEIGSGAFLRELQLDLAALGLTYPYRHCSQNPDNRSGLAVLSRVPLELVLFHDPVSLDCQGDVPVTMRRGIQEVRLRLDDKTCVFFHVHLKSRYSGNADDPTAEQVRSAEIRALAAFLESQMSILHDAGAILVGDLNTPVNSPLLEPLKASWAPVPARDPDLLEWTYVYWKTQVVEHLDGFWISASQSLPWSFAARIFPFPPPAPSDHRLVLLQLDTAGPS